MEQHKQVVEEEDGGQRTAEATDSGRVFEVVAVCSWLESDVVLFDDGQGGDVGHVAGGGGALLAFLKSLF